jgi:hypothetical protein
MNANFISHAFFGCRIFEYSYAQFHGMGTFYPKVVLIQAGKGSNPVKYSPYQPDDDQDNCENQRYVD